ncbi:MAG: M23 family peptidase, partial [Oscillospiraceae bacterium]|nr:M23 family peptidase [Oscillospiraceae bacterium]
MKRWIAFLIPVMLLFLQPVKAEPIRWVDFKVPEESLRCAMDADIRSAEQERHISWIDVLSVAACRTGGKCPQSSVKKAIKELEAGADPKELTGDHSRYYDYYHSAYEAILGGLLGNYSVNINGEEKPTYGLKAFSPIAAGYGYSHCSDFGNSRSFGFRRKHLGNDLMGT